MMGLNPSGKAVMAPISEPKSQVQTDSYGNSQSHNYIGCHPHYCYYGIRWILFWHHFLFDWRAAFYLQVGRDCFILKSTK